MFTKIATILSLMASLNTTIPVEQHSIYVRTMQVVQINYEADLVSCIDAVGFEWEFYGCEDYAENDLVSCIMDTMGTEETILDDAILDIYYTGYWMD
jgi:hypothetical protein